MTQPDTSGQGGGLPPGGTLDVPSADGRYSEATFEQILVAITGRGKHANLHGVTENGRTPGGGWLVQGDIAKDVRGDAQSFDIAYGAWDKTFIGVNRNTQLFDEWARVFGELVEFIGPLEQGRLDDLDVFRLIESAEAVESYAGWLALNYLVINSWIQALSSDDSEFKGKAAYVIRQNLVAVAEMMIGLYHQIMTERTPSTPTALKIVAVALLQFSRNMANILRALAWIVLIPGILIGEVHNNITKYLWGKGLFNPTFDLIAEAKGGRAGMEAYILSVIENYSSVDGEAPPAGTMLVEHNGVNQETGESFRVDYRQDVAGEPFDPYPLPKGLGELSGPLNQPATWDAINTKITRVVLDELAKLDKAAQGQLAALGEVYESTKLSLAKLEEVDTTTPGGGSGGSGDGPPPFQFPEPPKFEFDKPPPFEFKDPPKFEFGPPPDFDLPDLTNIGGGGPDLPDLRNLGGGPDLPGPGNIGGGPDLPGLGNFGGGPDLPGLNPTSGMPFTGLPFPGTSPPNGNGRTGPNIPNLVDENGNPIDPADLGLSDTPDFQPGPGLDIKAPTDTDFPAGGGGPDLDLPSRDEFALPGGGGAGPGGIGGPDGLGGAGGPGAGFPGSGLGDTPGAPAMGAGGEGWADWTGQSGESQNVERQNGGFAGMNNGLPMMPPPMMPQMMPGNQKDRERQTWLSEEEKVWGIKNNAGSGVVGLPADLAKEVDEQLAPTHVHVRSVGPRAKAGKQQPKKQEATQDGAQQQAGG
jgi:hypothetical protein